jgi:hypothetical protein
MRKIENLGVALRAFWRMVRFGFTALERQVNLLRMRFTKKHWSLVFLIIVVVGVANLLLPAIRRPGFLLFTQRNRNYYAELGKACDKLIQIYQPSPKQVVEILPPFGALPSIITELHPLRIKVTAKSVWILHPGNPNFGIVWDAQEEATKHQWVLSTACESHTTVLYRRVDQIYGKSKIEEGTH